MIEAASRVSAEAKLSAAWKAWKKTSRYPSAKALAGNES